MKWSWKIGEIKQIPIHIHTTFLILLAWIAIAHMGQGSSAMLGGVLFITLIFACVLLHELGHALAARRYGIKTRDITLLPIGGVARLERMPDDPKQELWVALAGPAVNLGIAAVLFAWLSLTTTGPTQLSLGLTTGLLLERLMAANIILAVFNLLPAFPMDGGRVVRSLLAMRMDHAKATGYAAGLGQLMAVLFGMLGLLFNPFLVIIAIFVWIGAEQENRYARMRSTFQGVPIPCAMVTDFRTLHPDDELESAIKIILSGSQQDFPVMEEDRVVGILTRDRLLKVLADNKGEKLLVGDVMLTDFPIIDANQTLEKAFFQMQTRQGSVMPVISNNRLIGLLTSENMSEYIMINSALEKNNNAA